jgi:hypothetical protein
MVSQASPPQEGDAMEDAQVLRGIEDLMEEERRLLSQGEAEQSCPRDWISSTSP